MKKEDRGTLLQTRKKGEIKKKKSKKRKERKERFRLRVRRRINNIN